MGVSIYYTVKRDTSLSEEERAAIVAAIKKYSVEDQIEQYDGTSKWLNWESFCVYPSDDPDDPLDPGVIFEGATRLPSNRDDAAFVGARRWCRLLTEIRHILHDAEWGVHIDGCPIKWDAATRRYDPGV